MPFVNKLLSRNFSLIRNATNKFPGFIKPKLWGDFRVAHASAEIKHHQVPNIAKPKQANIGTFPLFQQLHLPKQIVTKSNARSLNHLAGYKQNQEDPFCLPLKTPERQEHKKPEASHPTLKEGFRFVSLEEARLNPGYWQVVRASYERGYVFQEPIVDTKALEHAARINQTNGYTQLDFVDPEFHRNVFKALRLNKINANQMATAIMLHAAQEAFKEKDEAGMVFRSHKFTEKGPYHPSQVSYSDEKSVNNFFEQLVKLPDAEQVYFSIDLSRTQSIILLLIGLENRLYHLHEDGSAVFLEMLKQFVSQLPPEESKGIVVENLLGGSEELERSKLKEIIKNKEPAIAARFYGHLNNPKEATEQEQIFQDSCKYLLVLVDIHNQFPTLIARVKPAKDKFKFSLILPTMSAFVELQQAFHGEDTMDPYFSTGVITRKMIRMLDEHPQAVGRKRQCRPVQLPHPDAPPIGKVHKYKCNSLLVSWHDLLHCFRGGSIHKPIFRHLRQLFEIETGMEMLPPAMWAHLIDLDTLQGKHYRDAIKVGIDKKDAMALNLWNLLNKIGSDFWIDRDKSDEGLLVLFDMVINKQKWSDCLGMDLETILQRRQGDFDFLRENQVKLKNIVGQHPKQSHLFYILAYYLKDLPHVEIVLGILQKVDLKKYFQWGNNPESHVSKMNILVKGNLCQQTGILDANQVGLLRKEELDRLFKFICRQECPEKCVWDEATVSAANQRLK